MDFSRTLIGWYHVHKRDLPWRNSKDPYIIWLSEIILQQTRVDQGMPYFYRFTEAFPDVHALAEAEEEEVLRLWQGLGYYSRARNLHATARHIVQQHQGVFPKSYQTLLTLKGVGKYTAAAIASFAYNEAVPLVDGNVYRVLSRYFGIKDPIDSAKGQHTFLALAGELLDKKKPGTFNQAVMEFGAMQCRPVKPSCNTCPLHESCYAYAKKKIAELPTKTRTQKIKKRYFYYIVVQKGDFLFFRKRTKKDIWMNLYDFPLIETSCAISETALPATKAWQLILGKARPVIGSVSPEYRHQLSHQSLHARFIEVKIKGAIPPPFQHAFTRVRKQDISSLPLPRLIEKYLEKRMAIG